MLVEEGRMDGKLVEARDTYSPRKFRNSERLGT